jgi:FAD/FMN-containing dehydrogenase
VARVGGLVEALASEALEALASRLDGRLLREGQSGYEEARRIWNGRIERRPALIASCSSGADVVEVVRFARAHDLLVSVRGGGHNVGGTALCERGLMLDLSGMTEVSVEPQARRAVVGPGVRWKQFDAATQAHGLAAPGGQHSEVGVAGFTLGGGVGWLSRKYGLAIDSLKGVEIVTADGVLRRASASENPDLFWAVRGGGGNFGIVTSFEFELHAVGPIVRAGILVHPIARAREALCYFCELSLQASDDLDAVAVLMTGPDGQRGVAFGICHSGPAGLAEEAAARFRAFSPAVMDMVQPMPYVVLQSMLDGLVPAGRRYFNRSRFAKTLDDRALDLAIEHFAEAPSAGCTVFFHHLGGALGRVPVAATAFAHRDAQYSVVVEAGWQDASADQSHSSWVSRLTSAIEPYTMGCAYVNDLGRSADEGNAAIRAAYGSNYARLAALKSKYDPTNFFCHNQNVEPAA